ncbi:MAG: hypothetical protein GXY13_05595 [Acidimicrobiales bacterium]|nr:hypothetical protein [Acidimicrobiales bacterium]
MCDHCGCREFGPIAELSAEHEQILDLAWRVAEDEWTDEAGRREGRAELAAELALHATKEELGLYPLLMGTGDLTEERCDRLEDEHREVHAVLDGEAFDRRAYYALAAHIEEEEMELFSGAMFAFGDDEWDEMDRAHHRAAHLHGVAHAH